MFVAPNFYSSPFFSRLFNHLGRFSSSRKSNNFWSVTRVTGSLNRSSRAAASLRGVIYLSVLFAGKSGSPLVSATRGSSGEESSNDVLFSAGSEPPASRLLQPSPSECAPEIRVKARAAGSFQTSASGKGGRLGLELAGPRKNSLFQVFLRDSGFIFFFYKEDIIYS